MNLDSALGISVEGLDVALGVPDVTGAKKKQQRKSIPLESGLIQRASVYSRLCYGLVDKGLYFI